MLLCFFLEAFHIWVEYLFEHCWLVAIGEQFSEVAGQFLGTLAGHQSLQEDVLKIIVGLVLMLLHLCDEFFDGDQTIFVEMGFLAAVETSQMLVLGDTGWMEAEVFHGHFLVVFLGTRNAGVGHCSTI